MNKCILIITGLLIATQSFATGISGNSATCDSGALGSEDGSVAMRANYEPESIGLRWYDENNNLLTVNSASNSCTYGGTITIPNPPTKTGYKFTGWKIINILTTLDYTINALESNSNNYRWKPANYPSGYTMQNNFGTENSADLQNSEWVLKFSYGEIYGSSLCSSTMGSGTYSSFGTPDEKNSGQYCWCKANGFIPYGNSVKYTPYQSSWIYDTNRLSIADCEYICAFSCVSSLSSVAYKRQAVFGQLAN